MAGVTTTTIATEIEHLDFEAELPCEERPCAKTTPRPAELVADIRCPACKARERELICRQCWQWLLSIVCFECAICNTHLGPATSFIRVRPLRGGS